MNDEEIITTPEPTQTEVAVADYSEIVAAFEPLYMYHAFESMMLIYILLALFIIIGCHLGKSLWR